MISNLGAKYLPSGTFYVRRRNPKQSPVWCEMVDSLNPSLFCLEETSGKRPTSRKSGIWQMIWDIAEILRSLSSNQAQRNKETSLHSRQWCLVQRHDQGTYKCHLISSGNSLLGYRPLSSSWKVSFRVQSSPDQSRPSLWDLDMSGPWWHQSRRDIIAMWAGQPKSATDWSIEKEDDATQYTCVLPKRRD